MGPVGARLCGFSPPWLAVPHSLAYVSLSSLHPKASPSLSLSLLVAQQLLVWLLYLPLTACHPLCCLYIPQMRESHWEPETLDKEGLSESVRSCESCPGVPPSI